MIETQLECETMFEWNTNSKYRTKKIQLVLLSGKGGAGKSTSAKAIAERLVMYAGISVGVSPLAYPIKTNALEFYRWDGNKTTEKGRRLLQEIGDAGRNYDKDLFVKYLEERELSGVFPLNFILIDDWRYENEKSYFEKNFLYDVTTVRIERWQYLLPGNTSNHKSENSLPISEKENLVYNKDNYYNFEVHNNGTLDELYKKLDVITDYLSTKIIPY